MAEYARRRGVTAEAVRQAVKAGRIKLTRGKIDAARANREWKANTHPRHGGKRRGVVPGVAGGEAGADTYLAARTKREGAAARLAELEVLRQEGRLVDIADVREKVFRASRGARDLVLSIADRITPRVTGVAESHLVHAIIREECERVCAAITAAPL
jgi:hypothetical protein